VSREPIGTRSDEETIPAGDFSTWVETMVGAIRGERDADVPCGTCTACCTSSQFVHIEPDETDALAHIPAELLFPAPRLPRGHVLLGYNEKGHCPMLIEGACSIYEHRPRTCRTYDCRVFPAAGVEVGDDDAKVGIAERVRRWRFSYPAPEDRARHDAVRAAAVFVREHPVSMPSGSSPTSSTGLAVLAVELHERFLDRP
jgi:Fe-S-cluster containining protein